MLWCFIIYMPGYALHSWTCDVIFTFMHNVIMFLKGNHIPKR